MLRSRLLGFCASGRHKKVTKVDPGNTAMLCNHWKCDWTLPASNLEQLFCSQVGWKSREGLGGCMNTPLPGFCMCPSGLCHP